MKANLTVAALQIDLLWENAIGNKTKIGNLLEDLSPDVELVVLPEMFTSGFSQNSERLAEEMNGSTMEWLHKNADRYNLAIMGSMIVKEEGQFYNRMVFMEPGGIVQTYDKRHLFRMGDEHNYFSSGKERKVFDFRGWRILPQICYDLRFPVWSRNQNDYDLMVYVASWPESRRDVWSVLLQARAIENQAFVVGTNRIGEDGTGLTYSGDSVIIDPKGMIITSAKRGLEEIISAGLSLDELNAFRLKFPVWMDADDFSVR
ncbi:amidohydrolase [Williamwhitmania taraxaci]|uniref:Omega-amidase YafV n=1 Tax=Williamwhitmania taraxaci TaxID=1640674 RepID=A0A1G6Q974_9BACT|nr:amidohydrolase [Williamwhitmania taraxaci]SDC88873.1 Predicted amidohydrolase [Williamwhitmania taraxaci]